MKTTIDSAGRIVIPGTIRAAAGLTPNTPVQVRLRNGVVELEPSASSARVVRKGKLAVAVLDEPVEPLESDVVLATRDAVRGGRTR